MLVPALRRFVVLLLSVGGATAAVSALLGLATGSSLSRSVSLGFYLIGCFLLIAGFFVGNRGPVRTRGDETAGMASFLTNRRLRWATGTEQEESLNMSGVFIALGFAIVMLGVLTDMRHSVF
jgi:hypothetical protein